MASCCRAGTIDRFGACYAARGGTYRMGRQPDSIGWAGSPIAPILNPTGGDHAAIGTSGREPPRSPVVWDGPSSWRITMTARTTSHAK